MAARLHHVPYLPNITGLGTAFDHDTMMRTVLVRLYRCIAGHEQCVFFQNVGNRQKMEKLGIHWKNIIMIPGSGVNLQERALQEYPQDDGEIRFLFVARVMRDKGIHELIDAFQQIRSKYPECHLDIVGPCEEGYETRVREWDKLEGVTYHGEQTDMQPFYGHCHALVHPSYHEGLSNVCLEAASTGRPVLTTDVPGCRETVQDGVSGYLYRSKDVSTLVKAMERFIELPYAEKAKMGQMGRRYVEQHFDRQIVIDAYLHQLDILQKQMERRTK